MTLLERWRRWRHSTGNREIDAMIEHNRAKHRPGMNRPDMAIVARRGQERWAQVEAAQRRQGER